MKPWIALLRGINVGGKHVLPMKNLVSLLEDLHCQNVMTYIQSGNVVFKSEERDDTQLSGRIRDEINRRCGFEPAILLLQLQDMEQIIEENPFPRSESTPAIRLWSSVLILATRCSMSSGMSLFRSLRGGIRIVATLNR